jgi:stage III sporulation protein AH
MKIKKSTVVAAVVALLVCTAVYLNWSYQRGLADNNQSVAGESDDSERVAGYFDNNSKDTETGNKKSAIDQYFAQIRLTRKQTRDEAVALLEQTCEDEAISVEAKAAAVESLARIAGNALIESEIEGLVLSKGYYDCAAFLNADTLSIVVAAPEGGLKSEDAIRIRDIAVSKCDVAIENIRIIEARVN